MPGPRGATDAGLAVAGAVGDAPAEHPMSNTLTAAPARIERTMCICVPPADRRVRRILRRTMSTVPDQGQPSPTRRSLWNAVSDRCQPGSTDHVRLRCGSDLDDWAWACGCSLLAVRGEPTDPPVTDHDEQGGPDWAAYYRQTIGREPRPLYQRGEAMAAVGMNPVRRSRSDSAMGQRRSRC